MKWNMAKCVVRYATLFLAVSLGFWACSGDMNQQETIRAQQGPVLSTPEGSVPAQGRPKSYVQAEAARLANPLSASRASLEKGKALFAINCAMCHGEQARGDGPVGKKYIPRPADLTQQRIQNQADGQIFLTITRGFSTMPALGRELSEEERWHLVNYVKNLNFGQRG